MSHSDPTGKTSPNVSLPVPKKQKRVEGSATGRSRNEFKERYRKLDSLVRVSLEVIGSPDLQTLLQNVIDGARELTVSRVGVSGHGYAGNGFRLGAVSRSSDFSECPPTNLFTTERGGVYLELLQNCGSLCLSARQLHSHPKWWGLPEGHIPLRGLLGARLTDASENACGLIMVSDKADGSDYTPDDENLLTQLASLASLAIRHIDARNDAEQDRRHFQAVLANIDEGAFAVSPDGWFISMNPAALKIYEIDSLDAIDRNSIRFFSNYEMRDKTGRLLDETEYPCQRVLNGEKRFEETLRVLNKTTGRSRIVRFGGVPVYNTQGEITLAVLTIRDITRDKHVKETLRNTRDRLNTILSSIQDGFVVIDKDWRYTYINESAARLLNTTPDRLIGRVIWEAFPELRHSVFQIEFERALYEQRPVMFEAFHGAMSRWFECRCYPSDDGMTVLFTDNTERRRLEEALRDSEQRLNRVLAGSNDGYWEWDLENDRFEVSPRWLEIIGYAEGELNIDSSVIEPLIHSDDLSEFMRIIKFLRNGGKKLNRHEFELRIRHKDGYYLWVYTRGKVTLRAENGNAVRVSGTITDITERKKAQDLLRINEEIAIDRLAEIETIYLNAPVGLCVLDTDLRFVRLNERLADLNGISVAGHIGRSMREIAPDIASALEPIMHRVLVTGIPVSHYETSGTPMGRPGRKYYWLNHFYPLRNAEDEIIGLNVVIEDITDRKIAEEEARRRAAELEIIMDAVPAFILISHEPEGRHITGNRATQELLRVPPKTNLLPSLSPGSQHGMYKIIRDGKELPPDEFPLKQAAQGQHIEDCELDMVFLDGTVRTVYGRAEPIPDDQGKPRGAVAAFIDITERKQSEEKLREINTTLEYRVSERTAQLESLNTDLKRRAGQLQVLALKLSEAEDRERRRLAEMLHDDLQQLLAAAKLQLGQISELAGDNAPVMKVAELVDKILSESVRKTRNLSHELSPTVLSQQGLAAALKWLARQMEIKHGLSVEIKSETEAEPASPPLRVFLYKAVNEILFNVVKHAGVNTAKVTVRRAPGGVEVTVSDSGKGFDPGRMSGADSGFGLFSIQERIQMLGGEMRIESAPGEGSRFILRIAEPDDGFSRMDPPGLESSPRDADRGIIRIMVVDDHRMMRKGLSAILAKQPDIQIVAEAENGKQAVEKANRFQPDVILMDVSMPVMNGIEATRQIKELWPATRVIALSMYDETDIHVAMIQAGAATYLNKTGPSETLLAVIRGQSPGISP